MTAQYQFASKVKSASNPTRQAVLAEEQNRNLLLLYMTGMRETGYGPRITDMYNIYYFT